MENILTIDLNPLKKKLEEDGYELLEDPYGYGPNLNITKLMEWIEASIKKNIKLVK